MKAFTMLLFVGTLLIACKSETSSSVPDQPAALPDKKAPVNTEKENVKVTAEAPKPSAAAPVAENADIPVCKDSVLPGTSITKKGASLKLVGAPVKTGEKLPDITLKDALSGETVHTGTMKGKVLIISVVPAVATPVCSAQSRYMETEGDLLDNDHIVRITVSRDSIDQLQNFAKSTTESHVMYLSDKELNTFGGQTGLGVEGADILARSVIVVDKDGVVQYIQVVPEITQLPDMSRAFNVARGLVQ